MTKKLLLLAPAFFLACHPLSVFNPPPPQIFIEQKNQEPRLTVAIDEFGIPFINAKSVESALYGLGFMHARDRLFQLDVMRRAGLGTLSEIFGDRTLTIDQQMRILTYRLDEQVAILSEHEHQLIDAYVKGINDSAKHQGRSAEHFLLGARFETFSKRDVMAIARLQSWTLAADLKTELAFLSFAHKKLPHNLFYELFSSVNDRGSAILPKDYPPKTGQHFFMPDYIRDRTHHQKKPALTLNNDSFLPNGAASNAWAIHKNLSQDNVAMLFNDPHLRHTMPGNFYLATLKASDMFATGATFVGIPAILVGASSTVAWGVTASYTNAQDLVFLKRDATDKNSYFVDHKKYTLIDWPQKFCVKNKTECVEKNFYVSIFGPVIDHDYHSAIGKDELLAVMWTGFLVEEHTKIAEPFVTLAQAKTMEASVAAVSAMTFPGINMVLAHISGDIAYSFAGIIPKRDPTQNPHLPLDGAKKSSLWPGLKSKKPMAINPPKNYIVTANQNIYSFLAPTAHNFGTNCAPPYRALRINQRIDDMIAHHGQVNVDELKSIQLDSTSIEALELAKPLGQICVDKFSQESKNKQEFAKLIHEFDGNFTTESIGALPYHNLVRTIIDERYQNIFGTLATSSHIDYAIKDALRRELAGVATAVFANQRKNDINYYLGNMCEKSYNNLTAKISNKPWQWRWGRHHYLKRLGALASAPLVGGLFRDKKREVAGVDSAPLAEAGIPVTNGANLRFVAKMTVPPQITAVLDTGNSGLTGQKNALDQADLWHQGRSIPIETDFAQALKNAVLKFDLP